MAAGRTWGSMDLQLTGKRALVTGSSAGIGVGIAEMLAAGDAMLASPRSDFTNGVNLHLDGGFSPSPH